MTNPSENRKKADGYLLNSIEAALDEKDKWAKRNSDEARCHIDDLKKKIDEKNAEIERLAKEKNHWIKESIKHESQRDIHIAKYNVLLEDAERLVKLIHKHLDDPDMCDCNQFEKALAQWRVKYPQEEK